MLLPGLQACRLVYKPNIPVYGLVDQSVNYFSDTNNNYSIDYGLPAHTSADWSIRRDALADRSVMAYRPVHKQPALGVLRYGSRFVWGADRLWAIESTILADIGSKVTLKPDL